MASRCAAAFVGFIPFTVLGFSQAKEFSTNAICRQYNCINPVFPGVEDLRLLEAAKLQCQPSHDAKQHMQFCKNAVFYDVALPSPSKSSNATTLQSVVLRQDNAAATAYYYHLAGMNVEAWEHQHPDQNNDPCTQAVWRMVCHTYFPRAEAGCNPGEATKHLRPCKNVCASYVQACNVECCDESVQCVFSKKVALVNGKAMSISGYHDELGPSAKCTGAASRKSAPGVLAFLVAGLAFFQFLLPGRQSFRAGVAHVPRQSMRLPWARGTKFAMCLVLFAVCTMLQGCMGQIFSHPTPSWEQKRSYWERFQFIPEGAPAKQKVYNSCDLDLPKPDQCSGNGECRSWRADLKATVSGKTTKFCRCFRDWADPECRTKRKSQMVAFLLSVFLGPLGADHFYLNNFYSGFAKLATLGGCGVWWVWDIIRIGSAPVYANEYRLAYDLPHWFYVMFTVGLFSFLGYLFFGVLAKAYKWEKAKDKFLMREGEQHRKMMSSANSFFPEDKVGMPTCSSYSMPLPASGYGCYGAVPENIRNSGDLNPYSSYGFFQHATKGYSQPGPYDGRAKHENPVEFARMASAVWSAPQKLAPMSHGY